MSEKPCKPREKWSLLQFFRGAAGFIQEQNKFIWFCSSAKDLKVLKAPKFLLPLKPLNFYCPSAPLKTSRNAGRRSCSIHSTITFVTTTKDFFQNSHYHRLRNPTIMVTLLWSLFGYKCIDYSNKLTKKMICLKTCFAVLHHFQVHTK